MKFFKFIWNVIKNILWAFIILIIYFLLIGMIKNGGIINYFYFLNSRDWLEISKQISVSHPETLANIFYDASPISGSMILEGDVSTGDALIGIDTGNILNETGVNVYDPQFQEDFNNNLEDSFSGNEQLSGNFGFVSTGI